MSEKAIEKKARITPHTKRVLKKHLFVYAIKSAQKSRAGL